MPQIEIQGRPVVWKRVGVSRGRFFDRQAKERETFQWKLKAAYHKVPKNGPITLSCIFSFPITKSLSKSKKMTLLGKPHEGRPDLDNCLKWVADAGQQILWADDALIFELTAKKVWAEEGSTLINFEEANGEQFA